MSRLTALVLIASCTASASWTCLAVDDTDNFTKGEPLPNGYAIFFASSSEVALVKPATKGGECIVGPNVMELGNSGKYIFGRIEPKKGIPPHPDHASGFFVIDSATDKVTTGLDRKKWVAELEDLGVDSPELHPPAQKGPKRD